MWWGVWCGWEVGRKGGWGGRQRGVEGGGEGRRGLKEKSKLEEVERGESSLSPL